MYKICVFAGTSEGRKLVEFLGTQPIQVTACVATEYGETLLPTPENLTVLAGRLSRDEMGQFFLQSNFDLVVDATHPYADAVTENLIYACQTTGTEYFRLLRKTSEKAGGAVYVPDSQTAAAFLSKTEGTILLTTGTKELYQYCEIPDFAERVYVRVLPVAASLQSCAEAGLQPSHIFAMQGPFSEELNLAMLRFISANWLVTKESGSAGGFDEKVFAAEKAGVRLLVIGRPEQKNGYSFSQVVEILCERFGCSRMPKVTLVGIGPGSRRAMTKEVQQAVAQADCLIGAKRMLDTVAMPGQTTHVAITPETIVEYILTHLENQQYVIVLSGDVGFFSGAKKLIPLLSFCHLEVLPGLSSLAYFCAKQNISYEDVFVTSVHGRKHNVVADVRANRRVFVLTGGENGIAVLCRTLVEAGFGHVQVHVGESLSYPEETFVHGTAAGLAGGTYAPLSVALIENETPDAIVTAGLPDGLFQRGSRSNGMIPMTKSEVRAVCLSKLQLTEYAVCWDIGAGTGSVAIEMARQVRKGQVYAIERCEEAISLLEQNKAGFLAENLTVVHGNAPEVCFELPTPSHVFLGGSGGNLREILCMLLQKNANVRIVATAVSLESIAELTACIKTMPFIETEVVSLQVARGKQSGSYHLMAGQNPVYLFTMQAGAMPKIQAEGAVT